MYRLLPIALLLLPLWLHAEDRQANIIIENVTIADRDDRANDRTVNIIIKNGQLDLITESGRPDEENIAAFDAEGGVLLGAMDIGKPAGFLILDIDPRDNLDALLDTKTYGTFAIARGEVVRNRLSRVVAEKSKPSGWFSYTPPPFALPTKYDSQQKWNYYQGEKFRNLFSVGLVMDRTRWESQDSSNKLQVGELADNDGGEVRGLRFGVVGAFTVKDKPWIYTIFGATSAFDKGFDTDEDDDFLWFDYRLDIPVFEDNTISIGKQKEPINLERTTALIYLPFHERSAPADLFLPSRNVGLVLSGTQFDDRMSWASGVFNDWLDTGGSRSDSSSQFVGRVTGVPLRSQDESNLLHVGFGYRHSDVEEGVRGAVTPEVNSAPDFVDTGLIPDADKGQTFNYELSWRKGPWWMHAEYINTEIEDTPTGDLNFSGYQVFASRTLTGEMRAYNYKSGTFGRIPIARPVNHNGWGAWEVGVRYSHTDLNDGVIQGGEMDIWTVALNWWLRDDILTSINWRTVDLKRAPGAGLPVLDGQASGWTSRLVLLLD